MLKDLYQKTFDVAKDLQDYHVRTIGLDNQFHLATDSVYKDLLTMSHDVGEASEAAEQPIYPSEDCHLMHQDAFDAVEELIEEFEKEKSENKDTAVDNMLRTRIEQLKTMRIKLKAFVHQDAYEADEEKSETK